MLVLVAGGSFLCLAQSQKSIPLAKACSAENAAPCATKGPDQVLFENAMSAAQNKKFDVANLTFQTLVNTYPKSEYAAKARLKLQDPQIAHCGYSGESFTPHPECDPDIDKTPLPK